MKSFRDIVNESNDTKAIEKVYKKNKVLLRKDLEKKIRKENKHIEEFYYEDFVEDEDDVSFDISCVWLFPIEDFEKLYPKDAKVYNKHIGGDEVYVKINIILDEGDENSSTISHDIQYFEASDYNSPVDDFGNGYKEFSIVGDSKTSNVLKDFLKSVKL